MICETNLDNSIHSSEVFPQNFIVYRCDRSEDIELWQTVKKKRGGGVLIAVDKMINSQLIGTGASYGAEQVSVKIKLKNRNIFLVELYIRPNSPVEVYDANINALRYVTSKMNKEDILILSGDFNLPKLSWFTDDEDDCEIAIPINASDKKELAILDACHELGLNQINKQANMNNHMLDLIWTNFTDSVTCEVSSYHLLNHETHHPAFTIEIHGLEHTRPNNYTKSKYYDFMNADYNLINERLAAIDWTDILNGAISNIKFKKFYDIINSVIRTNVEVKERKSSIHPKWYDRDLISKKNKVSKLHKIMSSERNPETRENFTRVRSDYKKHARQAYRNYKLEMEELIHADPHKFFEFVNVSKKSSDDLPREMEYNNKKVHSQTDIANLFAEHFSNSYTKPTGKIAENYYHEESNLKDMCVNIPSIDITEELISSKVSKLPNNMVSGPDGVPNVFIKNTITQLIKPITYLLKQSVENSYVPNIWKKSYVRPIHKSGVKYKIENYRGVALQCVIPKLLDSIIANHINAHIKNIIDDSQHGFVKGRSTITNLAEFTSEVLCNMENGVQTDSLNIDLAKAFDTPNIDLLINKLNAMGLNKQLLQWIASYLQGRQQIVKIHEVMSNPIEVTSGTGQGYPIGATLFLLFIADMPKCIDSSKLQSFADDTRISKAINTINDCHELQRDLDNLVNYFEHNKLPLNVTKTTSISYHRGELKYEFISETPEL